MANISDAYKYIETGNNTVYNYNYTANDYNDTDEAPQDGGIDLDLVTTMHMVSFYCDVIGIILVSFVLALSTLPIREKAGAGPRVFAVNLLICNLAYALSSFFFNLQFVSDEYARLTPNDRGASPNTFWLKIAVLVRTEVVRSTILLVFVASYVPILTMFILACLRPFEFKTKSPTKRFVALVAVTDLVPVVIQVINKHLKKSDASSSMMLYLVTACALYLVQFTLTITAMWTILVQTRKLMVLQGKPVAARRKELVRALYFAIGPLLVQLPFVAYLVLNIVLSKLLDTEGGYEIYGQV